MKSVRAILVLSGALIALPLSAAVQGTVVTTDNRPVEGARVELADGSAFRITDAHGAFTFEGFEPPVAVRVIHPRFQALEGECCAEGGSFLVLLAKQEAYGEIVVTASREGSAGIQPVSVATSSISVEDRPGPAPSVVEFAEGMPGVAENGQGGLFQAYSIRGTGGQRVLTLVAGTRIVAERRAGAHRIDAALRVRMVDHRGAVAGGEHERVRYRLQVRVDLDEAAPVALQPGLPRPGPGSGAGGGDDHVGVELAGAADGHRVRPHRLGVGLDHPHAEGGQPLAHQPRGAARHAGQRRARRAPHPRSPPRGRR